MTETTILIFLKAPQPGYVKTRLAASIGPEAACEVYRLLCERQLNHLPNDASIEIHFSPADAEDQMSQWLGSERCFVPQTEGGLGERLWHAVDRAFRRGARQVLCVGGDCPQLDAQHYNAATERLSRGTDLVLGPSEDGGYYLIGLRQPRPELFSEIPWSCPETLQMTIAKAKALKLKIELLETLYDVDTLAELDRARLDGFEG